MTNQRATKNPRSFLVSPWFQPFLLGLLLAVSPPGFSLDVKPRIVGGVASEDGKWPWMAAILQRAESDMHLAAFCGGTLIHPSWVMTAAHCVFDQLGNPLVPGGIDVMVGEIDLLSGAERIPVFRIIPHPDYDGFADDIALLQLATTSPQRPIQLPGVTFLGQFHNPVVSPGTMATAAGWGLTAGSLARRSRGLTETSLPVADMAKIFLRPNLLREVELPIVDKDTCQRTPFGFLPIRDTELCAGFAAGGKGSCFGDSGGPLVAQSPATGNGPVQVGITSGVVSSNGSCAQPRTYGIYSRVSSYAQWITQNVCSPAEKPSAPAIQLSFNGTVAQLDFAPVPGATGYRLYWARYPEMYPVYQHDIGTVTSVRASLPSGTELWVAVDAYNGNCLSPFSNVEPLLVP